MIVDDASFMRSSIRKMVESQNFEVVAEAADGAEAVKQFRIYLPDIITMDITMPIMTGIEALKEIRNIDKCVKVIMVTTLGQESLIREAVIYGASSFIIKPFKKDKLLEVLKEISK